MKPNAAESSPAYDSGSADNKWELVQRVIPEVGTVFFHAYRMTGPWGALEADSGVLVSSDGRTRRLPAPTLVDSATISGPGWTLRLATGWVIREGTRRGSYEVVRQPDNR
jgi:hypothetical protein